VYFGVEVWTEGSYY
jgi:hypothetical protein